MTHSKTTNAGILLGFLVFAAFFQVNGQSFDAFIARMNSLPQASRQAVADSFMNSGHALPYIEQDSVVHFVYNVHATSVALAGDATGWNPDQPFTAISGCNFSYLTKTYEPDARLDYKLVTDGSNWILDPKNPYTCAGGFGPNSELRMPAYVVPPETRYYNAIPHGVVRDTTFTSAGLGNSRQVSIYLPDGYPSGREQYPVILFHDGTDYINLGNIGNILDYLIAERQMSPVIAVFVPPVDRTAEYAGAKIDLFTAFIVNELMPVIDAKYKTSRDPSQRAMAGASDGGNISLYIGMKHPEMFGKIAAQSSDVQTVISNTFANGPKLNLDLYIDIGTYDIAVLIPMVHNLHDILVSKAYPCMFREWHEGHSWGNWKGHLRLPLLRFFPYTTGMNEALPQDGFRLGPVTPDPFYGNTSIPFSAPSGSVITISLADLSGKTVETLFSGVVLGSDKVIEYHHHQAAGVYVLTMRDGGRVMKSLLIRAL
ncbi:MAG: alpha/beta hydrolase-fold protein [Bacteroidota bacterium]